jgi:hypothetical protein
MLHRHSLAVLACALLLPAASARAVNLVPNPSFESISSCPTGYGQIAVAAPWDTPNTGTSDCFNPCAPATFPSINAPYTQLGFQNANTGVGYVGIIPLSAAPDYREYVSAPLLAPLAAAQSYTVTFRVSLADTALLAIDRLGAYFSVGPVGPVPNYAPLPYTPQVESPAFAFLTNSTGWTSITGTFVATGGEDHITIGNFHDDATTNTTPGPGNWPGGSYYFIDDVSVEVVLPTLQACCTADGQCSMQFPGECTLVGGTPAGPGTTCTPDPCGPTPARRASWGRLKASYR